MKPDYLSASRITQYLNCPLKYRLCYEDKAPWDFHPSSMILGRAIHGAIEGFYRSNGEIPLEEMLELFNGFWDNEVEGKIIEPDCDPMSVKQQGEGLLKAFHSSVQLGVVLGVEEQFEIPLIDEDTGEFIGNLKGVIDLLEADTNGGLVIVDHKTCAKRPSDTDLDQHLQLSAYAFAVRRLKELGDAPILMRIDCLIKNKTPAFEQRFTLRTADRDPRFLKLCADVLQAIDAGAYPPNPGWGCGSCQVKSSCYYQGKQWIPKMS